MTARGAGLAAVVGAGLLACRAQLTPPVAPVVKTEEVRCPELPLVEDVATAADTVVGQTIARVCLLGASLETRATAERSLQVLAGQAVDTTRVREDLAILDGLGPYDEVAAYTMATERGLLLLYTVRERPRIAGFTLLGAEGFVELERLKPVAVNRPLDVRAVHELTRALRDRCLAAGHVQCQVEHVISPVAGGAQVQVTVQAGPVSRIGALSFVGARPQALAGLRAAAELRPGGPLVRARLEEARARVLLWYAMAGRLAAEVTLVEGPAAADGTVPLRFTVEEGRVYTLAGLHVTGSAAGEEARLLRDVVTLRVGAAYGRAAVAEDVARIKVDHESRGQQVWVTPRAVRDDARATIELSFEVARR